MFLYSQNISFPVFLFTQNFNEDNRRLRIEYVIYDNVRLPILHPRLVYNNIRTLSVKKVDTLSLLSDDSFITACDEFVNLCEVIYLEVRKIYFP